MGVRIGINGFGRMGRLGLRAAWGREELAFVRVNEISGDATCSAHLLKFDSVHGIWDRECGADGSDMIVDGTRIAHTSTATIGETDWSGCDLVIESSGRFRKPEQLQAYFDQGVKKVVVAAPVVGARNIVYGTKSLQRYVVHESGFCRFRELSRHISVDKPRRHRVYQNVSRRQETTGHHHG